MIDIQRVKDAARGQWPPILSQLGGVPAEILDGRHHPCPRCGGKDRFRLIDREAGACLCNQCFKERNGDGLAALMWMLGWTLPETVEQVAARLGMPDALVSPPTGKGAPKVWHCSKVVAEYVYQDEHGHPLFKVVRKECPEWDGLGKKPKDFPQFRIAGGRWLPGTKGVRRVPYRLPELLAEPKRDLFVTEGEKNCLDVVRLGLLATTAPMGAGNWGQLDPLAVDLAFRGRKVYVLPDNDRPGRDHASQVAKALHGLASEVCLVELPGLPEGGDVSDWIAAGGTAVKLNELCRAAAPWSPSAGGSQPENPEHGDAQPGLVTLTSFASIKPQPLKWLWPGRIPLGKMALTIGDPGLGKSLLSADIAARVSTGRGFADCPQMRPEPADVILLSAEDDPADTIRPRLDAAGADPGRVHVLEAVRRKDIGTGELREDQFLLDRDIDRLEEAIGMTERCRLVIVDPLSAYLGTIDGNDNSRLRGMLTPLAKLAAREGVAVLCVTHLRKSSGKTIHRAIGAGSGRCRTPVPVEGEHPFRSKVNTRSGGR